MPNLEPETLKPATSPSSILRAAISLVALTLLSIPALQPLLGSAFTCGYDNVLHLWRAVQADALLDHGIIYTRWQPHMALGLGYPCQLFNPPLSPLLAALFHRLGLEWPAAVNAVFVAGTLLSAWTVWLLVREWWGDLAGVVAGVVMATLPFHAYVNYHRASMSEALGWAFMPLILWGLIRWQKRGQRVGLLAAALGQAALLLTHDATAYLFLPLPVVAMLALALAHRSKAMLLRGALALGLGTGLATFFWMPSVLERGYVQFDRVLHYPYAASFVALDYLLEPPRAFDPSLINPWLPKGIGLLPAALSLLAIVTWIRAGREQRFWLAAVALVTAGYIGLTLPYAWPIWRRISVLQYLHFPWRFLTPAAVGVAVLTGAACAAFRPPTTHHGEVSGFKIPGSKLSTTPHAPPTRHHVSRFTHHASRITFHVSHLLCIPTIAAALVLGSLGWLSPPHCPLAQPATLPGMLAHERSTGELGGTFFSELLPVWMHDMPSEPSLEADINAGHEPVRLPPETLPEGTQVLRADYGPIQATVELDTPVPFRARYLAFYYPGWRVTVDGEAIPIAPTEPDGLIAFDVPAGHHIIVIRFGETALRLIADGISLLSLIALLALLIRPTRTTHHPPRTTHHAPRTTHHASRFTYHASRITHHVSRTPISYWLLILSSALLILIKLYLIDRFDNPLRRTNLHLETGFFPQDSVSDPGIIEPQPHTFGEEFILLGHDGLPENVPSGETFDITTYWQALQPGGPDYGVTIHIVDNQGRQWQGPDLPPPRWHRPPPPVGEWPPDQYADISLTVPILPGTPPGTYTVEAVAFNHDTLQPLTAHDDEGRALGPTLPLGHINVTIPAPSTMARAHETGFFGKNPVSSMGPLTLLGVEFDRDQAAPGDSVLLTIFWQAEQQPATDLAIHLRLEAPDGSTATEYEVPPTVRWHPTSTWQQGEIWRGQHFLRLAATLGDGKHTWHLSLEPAAGSLELPQTVRITAPGRTFTPPPVDLIVDTRLGETATLLGATVQPQTPQMEPGTPLTVTLVWRAEQETGASYHVFLHLLAPDGQLAAQSDAIPAAWSRPTTGWMPGEYITDIHRLTLPPDAPAGDYALIAGLYVPGGERLRTSDGADAVIVGTLKTRGQSPTSN